MRSGAGCVGLSKLAAWAVAIALGVLAVAAGIEKIRSSDYWWHLRAGYWIAENGVVPHVDPFTYTVSGWRWIDIHWLFQLGLAGVHSLGGHDGVIFAKTFLGVALTLILATIGWRRERAFLSGLALGAMLLIASARFMARPEMVSFLLFAAVLAILERNERHRDGWLYAIVPLQAVWVNVHGLFAVGIALCGTYLLAAAFDAFRARAGTPWRPLAAVTGLAALASLANPNFASGALYPLHQLGMVGLFGERIDLGRTVIELLPLWAPEIPRQWLALPGALLVACAAAMAVNWKQNRSRVAHLLLIGAFGLLALQANRNLALFAIVAAPLFVRNANEWLDRHAPSLRVCTLANVATAALVLLAAYDVGSGRFYLRMGSVQAPGLGYVGFFVPEGAADWIEREHPPGPIAHQMACGGYLSWRLYPDYKVMIDGRVDLFGARMLKALEFTNPAAFRRLDAKYHFGSVLLMPLRDPPPFTRWMLRNPEWRLVYADEAGLLFVRLDADGNAPWPAVDLEAPTLLPPFTGGDGPMMDWAHRRARSRMLYGLGRQREARAELNPRSQAGNAPAPQPPPELR